MRDFSQSSESEHSRDGEERKEAVELPEIPALPDVPKLSPTLPPLQRRNTDEGAKEYRQMGVAYSIPIALIAPIILLTAGGWWLDEKLHKSPYFTLGGALLGAAAGFLNMIRMVKKLNE